MRIQNSSSSQPADEQPTWRYWGEERLPGAVFTVYLKKVRYHSPTKSVANTTISSYSGGDRSGSSSSASSDDGISHLEWETVRVRFVKAATLPRLVEALASEATGELESTYVNVFLATYRSFASAKQVLNLLLERYDELRDPTSALRESVREQHRKTLRQALHVWLDQFPEDFQEPPNYPCLSQLESFTSRVMPDSELDQKVRRKARELRGSQQGIKSSSASAISDRGPPSSLKSSPLINQLLSASPLGPSAAPDHFNVKSPPSASSVLGHHHPHHPFQSASSTASTFGHNQTPPHRPDRGNPHYHFTNLLPGRHHSSTSTTSSSHPSHHGVIPPYSDFLEIPEDVFAQQLTRMDYELFKRVIPHQCLGSVWSRRRSSSASSATERNRDAASVVATVEQFNAVSFRVISTVLMEPDAKSSSRARVIAKWVDVAQELRVLKNFSSLKAIVSGLQSNPVYRLRRAWSHLARDKAETFAELARIFSEDNNALAQRELLVREGTARFADTVGENDHHLQKVLQKHSENSRAISYGTIPYLGTFLTDLTMIDTAIPDSVEVEPPSLPTADKKLSNEDDSDVTAEGDKVKKKNKETLINFDKRRKEFEVLAQIKLLQGAAKAYHIEAQPRFAQWWESVLVLDEREAFELSCQIEPNLGSGSQQSSSTSLLSSSTSVGNLLIPSKDGTDSANSSRHRFQKKKSSGMSGSNNNNTPFHRKNDSIDSRASSSSGSQLASSASDPATANKADAASSGDSPPSVLVSTRPSGVSSSASSTSSLPSLDASMASSGNNTTSKSEPLAATVTSTPVKPKPVDKRANSKSSLASTSTATSGGGGGDRMAGDSSSPYRTSEFYIIRVSIEESGPETEGVIMYKSIMIGNHEKTREVVRSAMMKHGLEGSPENYSLSQLLPEGKELLIPEKANVYYAISTAHDLNFILREKGEDLSAVGGNVSAEVANTSSSSTLSLSAASTPGSRHHRGHRDASKGRRRLLGIAL